ncbi:MAG: hypothetical protein HY901_31325 [Deltaproteobacteria bacterium]|nr:hypothetical protein [Deltaproteobacteria bacterium]
MVQWARVAWLGLLAAGCGAADGLKKLEDTFQVAGGGLDPSLLGTFRIDNPSFEAPSMLRLLVLRKDGTFHAELVMSCESQPCDVGVLDGRYNQTREFPEPSRASGVILVTTISGSEEAAAVAFRMILKRALVADSPQVGLYHPATTDVNGNAIPFFQMEHPFELWCSADADCEAQTQSAPCAYSCSAESCACAR